MIPVLLGAGREWLGGPMPLWAEIVLGVALVVLVALLVFAIVTIIREGW